MFSHGNKSQEKQFRVGPKTSLNFAELIPMKPRCSLPIAVNESWIEVLSHGIKMHTALQLPNLLGFGGIVGIYIVVVKHYYSWTHSVLLGILDICSLDDRRKIDSKIRKLTNN